LNRSDRSFGLSLLAVGAAALLWYLLFVLKPLNFWLEMSLSILALALFAFLAKRDLFSLGRLEPRHLAVGLVSFALLYLVFFVGNIVSGWILPFKDSQISMVYGNKAQASPLVIGLLLLFVIGPGEELFWRGFVQTRFAEKFGPNRGYVLAAAVYGGVHLITGNFMLVLAALVCGFYWGYLYKRGRSLIPVLISHALWDLTIFVLLPLK